MGLKMFLISYSKDHVLCNVHFLDLSSKKDEYARNRPFSAYFAVKGIGPNGLFFTFYAKQINKAHNMLWITWKNIEMQLLVLWVLSPSVIWDLRRTCTLEHVIKFYLYGVLGRTEGKKCLPIDSGIMGAYADMYRRLLVKRNPGAYFIKFWPPLLVVFMYCKHYNGTSRATRSRHC